MFADVPALHNALVQKDPRDFVSHFIFECVPYAFSGDMSSWIEWKTKLAEYLQVDPRDIVITGSGAIGYSLNPNKSFRPFDASSDIDTGVISPYHFELAWRYLRQLRPSWLSLPARSKKAIEIHRKSYVFSGTIATDIILGLLPFGSAWQAALDNMGKIAPTVGREVKLRIYKDFDALRNYQAYNIEQLRNELVSSPEAVAQVTTTEE